MKQGWQPRPGSPGQDLPPCKVPRWSSEPGPSGRAEQEPREDPLVALERLCLHPQPKLLLAFFAAHGSQLARVFGSPGLSPGQVYTLVRAVRCVLEGCATRQEAQPVVVAALHPVFLRQNLLGFIAHLEQFSGQEGQISPGVLGDTVAVLHHLLEAAPDQACSLLCYPVDFLWAVVQRLQTRGFQFTWITRKQVWDTKGLVDKAVSSFLQPGGFGGGHSHISVVNREDFRLIPVFPTIEDLFLEPPGRLKPNLCSGSYKDGQAYLDTHFRLLREDLVRPLREGISFHFALRSLFTDSQKRVEELRLYQDVQLVSVGTSPSGVTFLAKFPQPRRGVATSSKCLLNGSLVCLISNDSDHVLLGTVTGTPPKEYLPGAVWLELKESHTRLLAEVGRTIFTMVESPAFFESYRHVLASLQELDSTSVPFGKYLVSCCRQIARPSYLEVEGVTLDLEALRCPEGSPAAPDGCEEGPQEEVPLVDLSAVSPFSTQIWTPETFPHLDESQISAIQMALSNEFALIQGPPGTGKTFIGLKILETLLKNKALWNQGGTPCLVVCYTNHALDQFLEGILKFLPRGVVRIGGRSKSDKLLACSLKTLRKTYLLARNMKQFGEKRKDLCQQKENIAFCMEILELLPKGVLREQELEAEVAQDGLRGVGEGGILQWLKICPPGKKGREKSKAERSRWHFRHSRKPPATDMRNAQLFWHHRDERFLDDDFDEMDDDEEWHSSRTPQGKFAYIVAEEGSAHQKWLLDCLKERDVMTEPEVAMIRDVRSLKQKDRWRLYRRWVAAYEHQLKAALVEKMGTYEKEAAQLEELSFQEDLMILQHSRVIGMTTTGAAKYRRLLQKTRPRIVVVEEAAEILEAHVLSSLSSSCQHLILIGDHQQLRPKPASYTLEKKYGLGISLFERMVNNRLPHVQLLYQHRMRPEISQLLVPTFYKQLHDHQAVLEYEHIKGVERSVFFVQHTEEEESGGSRGVHESYSSKHEASFLVSLASYLLKQGYQPSQITCLTPYNGQVVRIRALLQEAKMEKVAAHAVDDFQGEENDIVLLSLVRSNRQGKIGFLKDKNRLCVALSRAKMGFYCIGNLKGLSASCRLWKEILALLKAKSLLGEELTLVCQNHPETKVAVKASSGFSYVPDGGCTLKCQVRLECGHPCVRFCHPSDREHKLTVCQFPCTKVLCEHNHTCPRKCSKPCGPCQVSVQKVIPKCGHSQTLPCHEPTATWICQEPCQQLLKCSHPCPLRCGESCWAARCKEMVEVHLPCSHLTQAECFRQEMPLPCHQKCQQELDCGHTCGGSCSQCLQGRVHTTCRRKCRRVLLCSHTCQGSCCENCPPCRKKCCTWCRHSRCDKTCGELCVPCRQACCWMCRHYQCTQGCSELCNRPWCDQPCQRRLQCKHPCVGLCGEPCPPMCRVCHREALAEIFFGSEDQPEARFVVLKDCKHVLEVQGLDRWMDDQPGPGEAHLIQQKVCPKCSTPIQSNPRYNNVIKTTQQRIEAIKRKVQGTEEERRAAWAALVGRLKASVKAHPSTPEALARGWMKMSLQDLRDWENTTSFLCCLQRLKGQAAKCTPERRKRLVEEVGLMEAWFGQRRPWEMFTAQQLRECRNEVKRLSYLANLSERLSLWEKSQAPSSAEAMAAVSTALALLNGQRPFTKAQEEVLWPPLETIDKLLPASGQQLSEAEIVSIAEAMRFGKGQWYQCPQGHLYNVGQCGRPMEESLCPECGATVGGQNHRVHPSNTSVNLAEGFSDRGREEGRHLTNIAESFAPCEHLGVPEATIPLCEPGRSPMPAGDDCPGEVVSSSCDSPAPSADPPPFSPSAEPCQLLGSEPGGTEEEEEEENDPTSTSPGSPWGHEEPIPLKAATAPAKAHDLGTQPLSCVAMTCLVEAEKEEAEKEEEEEEEKEEAEKEEAEKEEEEEEEEEEEAEEEEEEEEAEKEEAEKEEEEEEEEEAEAEKEEEEEEAEKEEAEKEEAEPGLPSEDSPSPSRTLEEDSPPLPASPSPQPSAV